MQVEFTPRFSRDLRQVRSTEVRRQVIEKIEEMEAANNLFDVAGVSRLTGAGRFYRIRIGNYRMGFSTAGDVVILERFLPRDQIYRYFP